MILADSINFPLVAGLGLITLGPLTLLVTVIEALVFRLHLKTGFRAVFTRVLGANILSTLAGGLVLFFQDGIIHATGIGDSIPAFIRGYRWVGPLLIGIYFAKSVLVEGFWLTRRRFLERVGRRAGGALGAVFIGNVLSYLVVGPLFYFTTRPHFEGVETTFDSPWTANADVVVYYVDRDTKQVKRARLDGRDARTLVPYPAWSFLVSEDESAVAYADENGGVFVYRTGDKEPTLLMKTEDGCFMTTVSLSPDNRRIAYCELPPGKSWPHGEGDTQTLKVMDLDTHEAVAIGTVPANAWGSPVAWSADGKSLYALQVERRPYLYGGTAGFETAIYVFNPDPPFGLREKTMSPPRTSEYVVNFLRAQGTATLSRRGSTFTLPRRFTMKEYQVEVWPYLGSAVIVRRGNEPILFLKNEYGLLNLSLPPVEGAVALPSGNELLLEWWGQLYVLDPVARRLGLVANGVQFVLRSPEFRVTFEMEDNR